MALADLYREQDRFEALFNRSSRRTQPSGGDAPARGGKSISWRSLHELAVTALFLLQHRGDAPQRFCDHAAVERWRAAKQYEAHCHTLGYEPFSAEELAEVRDDQAIRWAQEVSEHPEVVEKVTRYVEIHRELDTERPGPRQSALVDESCALRKHQIASF